MLCQAKIGSSQFAAALRPLEQVFADAVLGHSVQLSTDWYSDESPHLSLNDQTPTEVKFESLLPSSRAP
ncbi:MAG: hypothetical protein EB017_12625 [Betaproteobacteria bacterium]|nr:hypothetical protein [Betaproteobacteria bacterium]